MRELLQRISLFELLHRIDVDLAEAQKQGRCPYCSGPLHYAPYRRKPRGGPEDIPESCLIRYSLCCGNKDCRRRTLPPSCLFMGQRVYWGSVILVVMALRQNRPDGASANKLAALFSIPRSTLMRWFGYFRDLFPSSAQWQRLRGRASASVRDCELPNSLLESFLAGAQTLESGLVACLRFLASGWSGGP